MAVRKASMAALGVFGGISGVNAGAVGSALLVLFLIFHLLASP